jgi:hypothetical protein
MGVFMDEPVYSVVHCNNAAGRRPDVNMTTFEHFNDELVSIDMEIARLAQLCGIHMLQPGVAEAVLRGDSTLCNADNPVAWEKLRGLLVLHYHVVRKRPPPTVSRPRPRACAGRWRACANG